MEKVLGEIEGTETGCFGTEDRASPSCSFTCEDACVVFACELFVHSIEETYLTAADTYVACRDILVRTYAFPEFEHESLAETHDFSVGFSNRVEVRTAFRATHRESGQSVFESLLETEEFQH